MQTPNLVLVGPMGSGKSSTGRALAASLKRPFIDTDEEVVKRAGMSIPDIFRLQGEDAFREHEAAVIAALPPQRGLVVATGGGAIVRQANRDALARGGIVVCLWASPEVLWQRARRHGGRPLLQDDAGVNRLLAILEARKPYYDLYPRVETDGLTPAQVAEQLRALWEEAARA